VTAQGHPRRIFAAAIERGNIVIAEAAARELGRISVAAGVAQGRGAFVLLGSDGLERRADADVLRAVAAVTHRPPVIAGPPERWKLVHPVAAFWALLTTIERVLHGPSSSSPS
jgi:hypothetical protein